ncbi:hypothetical protein ZIOFF_001646 [Zingiber officinale]|uniref:Protein kinase domain-containing protein n=1 Tax=Zingiber officinale TaxID=94328 RepID=A0A8J5IN25_ZINOF|nr:hypothetical protein ZIOFF_001646 [Zingiber officinale]
MPAWWKGKSKSKSKSTSSPRTKELETPRTPLETPRTPLGTLDDQDELVKRGNKEKDSIFDELVSRKSGGHPLVGGGGGGRGVGGAGTGFMFGHPLPLPSEISLQGVPAGLASYSVSASSNCSSGSSDERPDLASYRNDVQRHEHVAEDRQIFSRGPVSEHPDRENGYPHAQTSTETIFSRRTANPSPGLRGYRFPTSPVHPSSFGLFPTSPNSWQDNLPGPPHPLPLPPSSPSSSHSPASSSSRSPKTQWKKGKLLGRGTFGHVYLGFNSELVEDTLSVFLEYVSGGSMHKILQEYGAFREALIRNYTAQILSGLAYLHGRNTVHRDIKGANILVDPNGEIKLADFGMAKHMAAYASIKSFKGSPYWMAPEVIMNTSGYDLSVDIWSLGCTIIEMATSKPPWSQFEGVAAIFKIGNSKDLPEIPDHFSPEGKEFLKLCLQRDPSARPSAALLMHHPFVRDQAMTKAPKFNLVKDVPHYITDASQITGTTDFTSSRSTSPLPDRDYSMRHSSALHSALPFASKNSRDLPSMRMNMSLPVSPSSSPLRQFKQSNRSCLPSPPHPAYSPPHPAYSAGAANYSPVNLSFYPTRSSNNLPDPWLDSNLLKAPTPYGSPRRLSMGL